MRARPLGTTEATDIGSRANSDMNVNVVESHVAAAVLIELLEAETWDWIAEVERRLAPTGGTPRERGDQLAALVAESLAQRPVLCDLNSAHAAVLEHNVSSAVALEHKRASLRALEAQAQLIRGYLPELGPHDASRLAGLTTLVVSSAWSYGRPSEALLAAYATDPALAAMRLTFTDLVRQSLEVSVSGLLARAEDKPLGPY